VFIETKDGQRWINIRYIKTVWWWPAEKTWAAEVDGEAMPIELAHGAQAVTILQKRSLDEE